MAEAEKQQNNRYFPAKNPKRIYELLRNRHSQLTRVSLSLDRSLERNGSNPRRSIKNRLIKSNPKRQDFPSLSFIKQKRSIATQGSEEKYLKVNSKQYFLKRLRQKPKCLDTSTLEPRRLRSEVQTLEPSELKPLNPPNFERSEIKYYDKVYFIGQSADKTRDGKTNWGFDDSEGSYLYKPHDHLAYRYEILGKLGQGSFGQVLKCKDHKEKKEVAVKIIKNRKRYTAQALVQMGILNQIKEAMDGSATRHIVQMLNSFMFRQHQCIVFELLSANLYQLLQNNGYQGLPLDLIRRFALQILTAVAVIHMNGVIHCDIKPENILLKQPERSGLKIIDFGSSCKSNEKVYSYLQSRYYRAPEVIVGINYNEKIDIWSLGCVFVELFLGYPIFPGKDERDQMRTIISILGYPSQSFLQKCPRNNLVPEREPGKRANSLESLIPEPAFRSFVKKCLIWDPFQRASVIKLIQDPWIMDGLPVQVRVQHEQYIRQLQLKVLKKNSFRVRNL